MLTVLINSTKDEIYARENTYLTKQKESISSLESYDTYHLNPRLTIEIKNNQITLNIAILK